jgi:hypothetical protein
MWLMNLIPTTVTGYNLTNPDLIATMVECPSVPGEILIPC